MLNLVELIHAGNFKRAEVQGDGKGKICLTLVFNSKPQVEILCIHDKEVSTVTYKLKGDIVSKYETRLPVAVLGESLYHEVADTVHQYRCGVIRKTAEVQSIMELTAHISSMFIGMLEKPYYIKADTEKKTVEVGVSERNVVGVIHVDNGVYKIGYDQTTNPNMVVNHVCNIVTKAYYGVR